MNVVDARDLGAFIPAVLDDYGLDPFEFRLYGHLARRAGTGGQCWESVKAIAAHCRMDQKTVTAKLQMLSSYGLIRAQRRAGQTSLIVLTPSAEWVEPHPKTGQPKNGSTLKGPHPETDQVLIQKRINTTPRNGSGVDPETDHKGTPSKVLPLRESPEGESPIVPQGGLDTAPPALALGGEANQPASPQPADSTPVEVVASSVKGRGSARRDRIAEVFELGRTALDVRRFHGQYRMLCNMVGAAPGALSKAQQAAASCWDGGEVPQGFEAGLAAFIWVKAAEAGAGHSCLAIPTFANFIENPHYGEDAIARRVMLEQHPELANPKTAKKAFEQHQVERAMSDWVNQPCEPVVAPSGPQPMSEAEEQRRHQQRIANLDLSAIPAPPPAPGVSHEARNL
jgi:hypothetical protein